MFGAKKFKKRIRVQFSDGVKTGRGFTHEVAEDSLFITCRKPLPRGTWIEIALETEKDRTAKAKAKVMSATKQLSGVGEGTMEVDLTLYNKAFSEFLISVVGELKRNDLSLLVKPGDFPGDPVDEVAPAHEERPEMALPEPTSEPEPEPETEPKTEPEPTPEPEPPKKEQKFIIIECNFCGTKNKLPEDKIFEGPICAICKEPLMSTS